MEAKEKVIAEKWIEAIGEENFKEVTLDADGVGSIPMELYYDNLGKFKLVTAYITTMIVIPKSLVGISNNNGWIRIESEKDFEKIQNGNYHWYNIDNGDWEDGDIPVSGKYTHYQTIKHPQTPLF